MMEQERLNYTMNSECQIDNYPIKEHLTAQNYQSIYVNESSNDLNKLKFKV